MLKKLHFWLAALACALCSVAYAQTDVTESLLSNAGFDDDSSWTTDNVTTGGSSANLYEVEEWTVSSSSSSLWNAGASFEIGGDGQINSVSIPTTNADGEAEGGVLGISAGWGCTACYEQDVTLPAGIVNITYAAYNANSSATTIGTNLIGFVAEDGTTYYGSTTSFTYDEWVTEIISFELDAETSGTISVGMTPSSSSGSGSHAKLCIDYIQITTGLDLTEYNAAKAEAEAAIAEYPDYTGDELTTLQALIDAEDPTTLSGSEEAITALEEATEAFIEAAYAAEVIAWLPCTSSVGTSSSDWSGATGTYTYSTNDVSLTACEYYNNGVISAQTIFTQTISGLEAGTYEVQVYATAHAAWWSGSLDGITDINSAVSGIAQVYALSGEDKDSIDVPAYYNTGMDSTEPDTYTVTVVVEEGADLEIGLEVLEDGYVNWMTIQIASLKRGLTEEQALEYYLEYVGDAETLVESEYLASTIAATLQEYIDLTPERDEYTDAFEAIEAAITAAKASIELNETLAGGGSIDAGSAITGWATTNSNYLQYNTWSTETDNYGVEQPFVENWVSSSSTLDAGTKTYYTAEGLLAGAYKVTGTVRILNESGTESITGAEFFVNDVTEDLTETGTEITDFNSSDVTALYGFIELGVRMSEDGDLQFGLNIGEDVNYNWVAFKEFAITAISEDSLADVSELETAIAASEATYDASFFGDGIYLIPTADGEAYAEAIAVATAVYDNAVSTQDEVDAALAALLEADSVFALAEVNQPSDTVMYTFQQTSSGYYLSIDEESESTSGNIVLDEDEYPFYIITSNDSVFLVSESGEYVCHYGSTTWTMGTSTDGGSTGTVHDFTITPYEEEDGVVHYVLVCAYNSLSVASDATDVGSALYDNKSLGHANGLWIISEYEVEADPLGKKALLKAITASTTAYESASIGEALFQTPQEAVDTYAEAIAAAQAVYDSEDESQTADDVTAAIEALEAADAVFAAAVNAPVEGQLYTLQNKQTGYYLAVNDDATGTTGNIVMSSTDEEAWYISYDSSTGYAQLYNENDEYICYPGTNTWTMGTSGDVFDFGIIPTEIDDTYYYQLEVYVNSRTRVVGTYDDDSDPATLYCDKVYSSIGDWGLWTIAEYDDGGISEGDTVNGYVVVGTEVVEVEVLEQTSYTGDTAEFDLEALLAALGTDDVSNCTQWIMNATDNSFVTNSTDSWRNADGDMETWGTSDGMVCVKIDDASSGTIDYIGTIDASYEAGDEYDAYWAFTYGESVYIIDVHITFVAAEVVSTDDYTIVGSTEIAISAEPDDNYTTTAAEIDEDAIVAALGCETLDDATFAAVVDGSVITIYTANYGYYYNSSLETCNWGDDGCSFFVEYYGAGYGYLALGQYPDACSGGESFTVTLYFIYGENAYSVTVTYSIESDDETGIGSISADGTFEATSIHSLSGQLIRTQATSLEGLPQGIYIVGGKKVLVK